jgi:hypothetical protein
MPMGNLDFMMGIVSLNHIFLRDMKSKLPFVNISIKIMRREAWTPNPCNRFRTAFRAGMTSLRIIYD